VTVVDASVVADAIRGAGGAAQTALSRAAAPIAAPELMDLEVASAYRKLVAAGILTGEEGRELVDRLRALPVDRHGHVTLLPRIWELRSRMTAYDAAYVALAERLGAVLLTRDAGLGSASGLRCTVDLVV
jgi:predicted nucleic acid-binding protein